MALNYSRNLMDKKKKATRSRSRSRSPAKPKIIKVRSRSPSPSSTLAAPNDFSSYRSCSRSPSPRSPSLHNVPEGESDAESSDDEEVSRSAYSISRSRSRSRSLHKKAARYCQEHKGVNLREPGDTYNGAVARVSRGSAESDLTSVCCALIPCPAKGKEFVKQVRKVFKIDDATHVELEYEKGDCGFVELDMFHYDFMPTRIKEQCKADSKRPFLLKLTAPDAGKEEA